MKRVVAIADLHVGSRVGLALPGHGVGEEIRSNIYEFWKSCTSGKWAAPDILIIDGDVIDGCNRKEVGLGTWTTNILEQCDEAVKLIKMWNAKKIYVIRGSDYHVQNGNIPAEELVARDLKAEGYNPDADMKTGWHLYLTVDEITFHISHKVGVSKVFQYKTTATAKEMLYAKLNDMLRHEMGKYKTNIVLRAHSHDFVSVEYSSMLGITLPCWKAVDDFAAKNGAIALSPDIGFVGFEIDGKNYIRDKQLARLTDVQEAPHVIV